MHMQMTLALEQALGQAPENWEWTPLGDLVARIETSVLTMSSGTAKRAEFTISIFLTA